MTNAVVRERLVALANRIELWPIEKLRPYERNPRTHSEAQVDQIAASMVEFGWTNPVLVDEQGGVLAGHGRLLAARKLGLAEVPVIRFEQLSEAQKRAYLVADNQLALQAGWSEELLAQESVPRRHRHGQAVVPVIAAAAAAKLPLEIHELHVRWRQQAVPAGQAISLGQRH
jgi:ParB-like chromosome segregation protein Spo0J